jgi:hypothetical protein
VRITKDRLDLEPATVTVLPVALDENHLRVYQAVASGLAGSLEDLQFGRDFASTALARLVAAASNPTLLLRDPAEREVDWGGDLTPGEQAITDLLAAVANVVRPAKLLAAASLAREHAERGEKVLVWTNFIGNVRELERLLEPYNPAVITGSVARDDPAAATDRVRQLQKFREETSCAVLIANLRCMSIARSTPACFSSRWTAPIASGCRRGRPRR